MNHIKNISITSFLLMMLMLSFNITVGAEALSINSSLSFANKSLINTSTRLTNAQRARAARAARIEKDNRAKEALNQVVMRPPWDNGNIYDSVQELDDSGVNEYIRQMSRDSMDKKLVYINLSNQEFIALEDGVVVKQSKITSGKNKFSTIQGEYQIWDKKYKFTLRSPGPAYGRYVLPVDYWMPFHKGYGLHDAPWRSVFGSQNYIYSGSHGCVNMQNQDARWLFEWSNIGTTVFVSK